MGHNEHIYQHTYRRNNKNYHRQTKKENDNALYIKQIEIIAPDFTTLNSIK